MEKIYHYSFRHAMCVNLGYLKGSIFSFVWKYLNTFPSIQKKILIHLFRENKLLYVLEGVSAWLQIIGSVNVSGSHIDRKASALIQEDTSLISEHSLLVELEVLVQIHLNRQKSQRSHSWIRSENQSNAISFPYCKYVNHQKYQNSLFVLRYSFFIF